MRRRERRPQRVRHAAAAAITLIVAAAALPAPAGAQVAWSAPVAERFLGGPSRAGLAPWGLAYNPVNGELVVGDYLANRLRRYSVDGTYLGDFVDPGGTAGGVASGVAVDPRDGAVYVAVTGDQLTATKDIRKYSANGTFLYDFDVPDGVTWLAVGNDGVLVVPEAFGETVRLVTVNDATRTATTGPPFGPAFGRVTSADVAADGTMYVAHPTSGVLHVYARDGHELRTIGSRAVFPGDMRGVPLDEARGRLYVADAQTGEIDVFSLDGGHIGQIGSGGPSGITAGPDGRLYVVEQRNARLQIFGPGPVPPADGAAPTVTWTGPANNSISSVWPVVVGGHVADPTGVAQVQVAVKDVGTGQLWDGTNTRWGTWVWNQAVVSGSVEDGSWSFTLVPAVPGRRYQFTVRALDRRGAISTSSTRTFTFADTSPLVVAITTTALPQGSTAVTGTMADDLGTVGVSVGVEDPATGRWWDPAVAAWSTTPVLTPAGGPSAPGALAPAQTGPWSWPVDTTPLPPWVVIHARATDAAGSTTAAAVTATVDQADLSAPDTAVTSPPGWANLPGVALAGTALDNQAVAAVEVTVKNLGTGQWWDGATQTWVASVRWNPARVSPTGGPAAQWSYPLSLPAGRWQLRARATDATGHVDATPAQVPFRIS